MHQSGIMENVKLNSNNPRNKVSISQRNALRRLANDLIVNKMADKGGVIFIMDNENYISVF